MVGKWLGGSLGFVMGGPIGALLGFIVGSVIDLATDANASPGMPGSHTAQGDFRVSLIVLVAAVMKVDGKVVKLELDYVKQFFVRQFGQESAREALALLKDILKKDILVRDICRQISANMDYSSRLQLLHLLLNISLADGAINKAEIDLIEKISGALEISGSDFVSIRNMFIPETDSSYKILEIDRTATDDDIKKAYRKMAMKYHPDKVGHLGDDFRQAADDKFKKVNEAYNKIKKERDIA
ncbi:MAG: TerB family tellurite resistance protein [Bacteroidales bacterium]|jgi:DnaJ like chaperone protein|nr:TerB family tellurite resistance protein [Bacteroidales bacterium]